MNTSVRVGKLALCFTILALNGCSDGANDGSGTSYPETVTQQSIEQCTQSGADPEICACVTKEIQRLISYEEMLAIEAEYGSRPSSA